MSLMKSSINCGDFEEGNERGVEQENTTEEGGENNCWKQFSFHQVLEPKETGPQ